MIYSNNMDIIADSALLESGFFEDLDKWKTANQNHAINKFKNNVLTNDEYNKLKGHLDVMRTTDNYDEYKKEFSKFCYFCHIMARGVIFRKIQLKKGKDNKNSIYVEYAYNTKKITLPEDIELYHMSSVDGITELNPYFRGKSVKGYLYDKPRVYFTIRKNMPKFLADYKPTQKLHMYKCKEKIRNVFVDPLVWNKWQGAVYVESNKPIKVEQIDNKIDTKNESYIELNNLLEFVDRSGIELIEII